VIFVFSLDLKDSGPGSIANGGSLEDAGSREPWSPSGADIAFSVVELCDENDLSIQVYLIDRCC